MTHYFLKIIMYKYFSFYLKLYCSIFFTKLSFWVFNLNNLNTKKMKNEERKHFLFLICLRVYDSIQYIFPKKSKTKKI